MMRSKTNIVSESLLNTNMTFDMHLATTYLLKKLISRGGIEKD